MTWFTVEEARVVESRLMDDLFLVKGNPSFLRLLIEVELSDVWDEFLESWR